MGNTFSGDISSLTTRLHFSIAFVLIITAFYSPLLAKSFGWGKRIADRYGGLTVQLDPYESFVSVFYSLSKKKSVIHTPDSEFLFYQKLFLKSFIPSYLLLQFSEYPLAHGITALSEQSSATYNRFSWKNINLLSLLASGFEEPYAFSVFSGYLTPLWHNTAKGPKRQIGSAIAGFVFTMGPHHILNYGFLDDVWYEVEWKVKGSKKTTDGFLSWRLQMGSKIHRHPALMDVVSATLFRSNIDRNHRWITLLRNSSFEYRVEMPVEFFKGAPLGEHMFSRHYLNVGINIPSQKFKTIVYTLNAGYAWKLYRMTSNESFKEESKIFVRPNILF